LPNGYEFISKDLNINRIKHDKCGNIFEIQTQLIRIRNNKNSEICNICNKVCYYKEEKISKYIKSIYDGKIINNYRDGLEIDVYLPELNIGFEFNGLYWHSEIYKNKNYHLNKTTHFKERGIRIINIWEDDWDYKREIIESIIKSNINKYEKVVYARNCKFSEISNKESKEFLIKNHLQGWCVSKYRYGLKYKGDIVSLITISKKKAKYGNKGCRIW